MRASAVAVRVKVIVELDEGEIAVGDRYLLDEGEGRLAEEVVRELSSGFLVPCNISVMLPGHEYPGGVILSGTTQNKII